MIAINKNIVIRMLGNRNANCVKNSIEYPKKENNYGFRLLQLSKYILKSDEKTHSNSFSDKNVSQIRKNDVKYEVSRENKGSHAPPRIP